MNVMNIELEEKIDQIISITYRDETTGLPVDLTGSSGLLEVRDFFGGTNVILSMTTENGKIVFGGASGAIDIVFLKQDIDETSIPSPWVRAAYDLLVIDQSGFRKKLLKGFVTLARSSSVS